MNIPYTIVMDLARTLVTSSILIAENDLNSRTINLVMMNNGVALDLSNVDHVQIKGIHEDDTSIYDDECATIKVDEAGNRTNVIECVLPESLTKRVGLSTFTVTLFASEEDAYQITTPEFYVRVKPQLYDLTERLEEYDAMDGIAEAAANMALQRITIPTRVSDLTNDSGYLTIADLPVYDGTVI